MIEPVESVSETPKAEPTASVTTLEEPGATAALGVGAGKGRTTGGTKPQDTFTASPLLESGNTEDLDDGLLYSLDASTLTSYGATDDGSSGGGAAARPVSTTGPTSVYVNDGDFSVVGGGSSGFDDHPPQLLEGAADLGTDLGFSETSPVFPRGGGGGGFDDLIGPATNLSIGEHLGPVSFSVPINPGEKSEAEKLRHPVIYGPGGAGTTSLGVSAWIPASSLVVGAGTNLDKNEFYFRLGFGAHGGLGPIGFGFHEGHEWGFNDWRPYMKSYSTRTVGPISVTTTEPIKPEDAEDDSVPPFINRKDLVA